VCVCAVVRTVNGGFGGAVFDEGGYVDLTLANNLCRLVDTQFLCILYHSSATTCTFYQKDIIKHQFENINCLSAHALGEVLPIHLHSFLNESTNILHISYTHTHTYTERDMNSGAHTNPLQPCTHFPLSLIATHLDLGPGGGPG